MEGISSGANSIRVAEPAAGIAEKIRLFASLLDCPESEAHVSAALNELVGEPRSAEESERLSRSLDVLISETGKRRAEASERTEKKSPRSDHSKEKMLEAAMFSHLGDGMIVIDSSGKIYTINTRAKELIGYKESDKVHGVRYASRFALQDREGNPVSPERDPIKRAVESGEPVRVTLSDDLYCARKGSLSFPVSLTASPISYNKKVRGVVVIFDDITQEKKIDEVKSDFIYIASHQLRTPLTVSTLHTEMLLAGHVGEISKEQREYLQEIHFYNKKMAQLLSVFMTVSKIELGTFVMQTKPVDLALSMDDVLHELNTQIKNKRLAVEKQYGDMPYVSTDPEFARIIFQNLVSNAVKYTPHDGRIRITLSCDGHSARITVEDTGCGIPSLEQGQVFTKLYRGTNTKSHRWDSNGLGLYITKSIIDKCGGTIEFKSKENEGTTFTVTLPLGEEDKAEMMTA